MTPDTHPQELLADYVDGTLAPGERAVVDAHLSTCATCREEVELARGAVTALSSLEELPVPFGVTGPVLAEAGRRFERRRAAVWERLQWAAGAAAAAALVLVVALNVGDGGDELPAAAGGDAEAAAPERTAAAFAAPEVIEKQDRSFGDAGVRTLALDAAASSDGDERDEAAAGVTEADVAVEFVPAADGLRCLRTAGAPLDEPADELFRLIEARYGRTPAYLAVFLESPGAGQPPDTVVVWVVAKRDCRILTFASQNL